MKKMLTVFAITSMLFATSCSNEELDNLTKETNNANSTVTFTAQLSNAMQTRAFADGTTATTLDYAVYEVGDNNNWELLPDLGKADQTINIRQPFR